MTELEYVNAKNLVLVNGARKLLQDVVVSPETRAGGNWHASTTALFKLMEDLYNELGEFDGGMDEAPGDRKRDSESSVV